MRSAISKKTMKIVLTLLVVGVVLLNVLTYAVSVVRYYGDGMEPTLQNGQILIIAKTNDVSEGDIIAFYYNNKILVRRVICAGGKTIALDPSGAVSVSGKTVDEPYVSLPSVGQCDITFPYSVPRHHVFVMGDNRTVAMDSRLEAIGAIPEDRIIGRVLFAW